MGLDIHSARFSWNQKLCGVQFGRVLTLGRQAVYMPISQYQAHVQTPGVKHAQAGYAEDFFTGLGATALDSMEASIRFPIGRAFAR